jgi:threonylcarbamoyladenosine tRNA methylthiotransferase MtaB
MVGFPGENEDNFKNTAGLIKEILPLRVHIFPYSPRQGTAAYNFKDRINPIRIKERMLRLQNIANICNATYKKQFLNKYMDVLIEERAKENKDYWQGYTGNYIKIWIKSDKNLKNQLVPLKLKKIFKDYILADLVKGGTA